MLRFLAIACLVPLLASCEGAAIGERCAATTECASHLQCLEEVCVPRCELDEDCGDGFVCSAGGLCEVVVSALGDPCERERDCGPGQSCRLDSADFDGDGRLASSCQPPSAGGKVTAAPCDGDDACRNGTCVLGLCTEMCAADSDCPSATTCAAVPRLAAGGALFDGCLPDRGVIAHTLEASEPAVSLRIPVPSTARSFALVSRIDLVGQLVGLTRLVAPSGTVLFRKPLTPADEAQNVVRTQPSSQVATLLVPNTDRIELETGVYRADVAVTTPLGTPGTQVPELTVFYKLDDSKILDLEIVLLDLDDHPCAAAWGGGELSAQTAPENPGLTQLVDGVGTILSAADITLGEVRYRDLSRPHLDRLPRQAAGDLFALAEAAPGITVFVVRSIAPDGVQALIGGTPGPPRTPGTNASAVVLSADTLCYRSWTDLSRVAAHSLATQMGLYENRGPTGAVDPIADSDESADNLMFFGEFGGVELSPGQRAVLGRYPGLR